MIKPVTVIAAILISNIVFADGIVVAKLGNTVSSSPYVASTNANTKLDNPPATQELVNSNFTVKSSITPGAVETRKISESMPIQPMYLVGTDELSINWVNKYKKTLQAIHARGYLINVKDHDDYENFVKKTGLNLAPISGDLIVQHYHLTHYPVLITNKMIEQ